MNGAVGIDSISGGDGDDVIHGAQGADTLDGGAGFDTATYRHSNSGVNVHLAAQTASGGDAEGDVLSGIENLSGSAHDDSLAGDGGANVLHGAVGDDSLQGLDGDDVLIGAAGADSIDGGAGLDTVDYAASAFGVTIDLSTNAGSGGDAAGDVLSGVERIIGSASSDTLTGGEGANVLSGGAGDDVLAGLSGADALAGGAGFDTANYAMSDAAVTIDLSTNTASGGDADGDTLSEIENVVGSAFSDTLTGDAGANVLSGLAGADALVGGAGVDTAGYAASGAGVTVDLSTNTVNGGDAEGDTLSGIESAIGSAFDDALTGDAFANALTGGAGDDVLTGLAGADALAGGAGVDTVDYAASNAGVTANLFTNAGSGGHAAGDTLSGLENAIGSAFSDALTGNADVNVLTGGGGDDVIAGLAGADILAGGLGVDTIDYSDVSGGAVAVHLGSQTASGGHADGDVLSGFENAFGSSANDTLTGDDGANLLRGGAGADTLSGGAGIDTVDYTNSNQGVFVDLAATAASGGHAAGDVLFGIENIIGSALNDRLTGDSGDNVLRGGAGGADWLVGGGGSDTASYAGGAAVAVSLLHGSVQNTGGQGWDLLDSIANLTGSSFDDWLTGEHGANVLDGGAGADHLNGLDGDDRFVQRAAVDGVDQIDGGAGFDAIDYATAGAGVSVQLLGWSTTSGGALLTTFSGIEAAIGSAFNDALIGDAANNRLTGGAGGDDNFVQGIEAGGIDRLFGDAGTDTIDYGAAGAGVTVQLVGYSTSGGVTLATFNGVENAIGTAFSDVLVGNAANNRLDGGAGSDWLVGGVGDDTFVQRIQTGVDRIFGDAGTDTLDYSGASAGVVVQLSGYATSGGATLATFTGIEGAIGTSFSDTLVGTAADNRLTGGAGGDWLVGGAGADTFVYRSVTDGAGDSIRDFSQGENDLIDLSAIDADAATAGDQFFTLASSRTAGVVGEAVVTNFGGWSLVSLYLGADNIADMTIQVVHQNGVVVSASDFVL